MPDDRQHDPKEPRPRTEISPVMASESARNSAMLCASDLQSGWRRRVGRGYWQGLIIMPFDQLHTFTTRPRRQECEYFVDSMLIICIQIPTTSKYFLQAGTFAPANFSLNHLPAIPGLRMASSVKIIPLGLCRLWYGPR